MDNQDGIEQSERATPKRIKDAKEKGQVPRSRELGTTILLITSAVYFLLSGDVLINKMLSLLSTGLVAPTNLTTNIDSQFLVLSTALFQAGVMLVPFFVILYIVALFTPLTIGGWSFSTTSLMPDFNRLDPIKGIARLLSVKGLIELIKALAKFALVGIVSLCVIWFYLPDIISSDKDNANSGIFQVGEILLWGFIWISSSTLIIAFIDVPFQLWDHGRKLMMTKQELKDEMKDTEGKPEIKNRIRRQRMEISQARMITKVPLADVILTNPDHFAVALKYDRNKHRAPIVLAKGMDLVAIQIRKRADTAKIPTVEIPSLARAIFYSTKLNHPIPSGLFLATAKVLAYVYQLKSVSTLKNNYIHPPSEDEIFIPEELRA